jgi:nucleoside 2-deoxyribosyltransferase
MPTRAFLAYPAAPAPLGETIERAILPHRQELLSWRALDIAGHFISNEIETSVDDVEYLIADVTFLNFNVTYEVGYAIGRGKRVFPIRNRSFQEASPTIREVGIFDTIGYKDYENAEELRNLLHTFSGDDPLTIAPTRNKRAPIYLIEAKHKTDWMSRIVSRVKKSGYIFRSFDPNESPRLSAHEAISHVAQSYGVLVPLLSSDQSGAAIHNMRAAFIAGLAAGMRKPLCIAQQSSGPVPLDVQDLVETTKKIDDLNEIIATLTAEVARAFQEDDVATHTAPPTFLQTLDLGASSAENEMRTLAGYYLSTDAFLKSLRGEAHLVVGRKGSGKSAIFLQIRDRERGRDPTNNIVLDLKPEGYKLVKFKETVLRFLREGTLQHTVTAFWNYILLLEICYKILEKDHKRHLHDHRLHDGYKRLETLYNVYDYFSEGDFSERIGNLLEKIQSEYQFKYGEREGINLTTPQVTELLYRHDVKKLEIEITNYMQYKGVLWLLFDNVDKGWPTTGLTHEDLTIIRCLIEASRKIEREFDKHDVTVNTVVFLRNDVYELLVQDTSDRGKEGNVMLDWTDQDLLKELVRLRIVANGLGEDAPLQRVWPLICIPHFRGEDSLQYLIDRSLMRPRFLLNLIAQCKASAVNLRHARIEEQDIEKGLAAFSVDVLTDVEFEMNDVSPGAGDSLYAFIDAGTSLTSEDVARLLKSAGIKESDAPNIINLLLWYGFLGVQVDLEETRYIYNFSYSVRMLNGFLKSRPGATYSVNPAFAKALAVSAPLKD